MRKNAFLRYVQGSRMPVIADKLCHTIHFIPEIHEDLYNGGKIAVTHASYRGMFCTADVPLKLLNSVGLQMKFCTKDYLLFRVTTVLKKTLR